MKFTSKSAIPKVEDIKFPCLMKFVKGRRKNTSGVVVLMVEKGKGLVVRDPDSKFKKGHWSTNWHEDTTPGDSGNYWTPWDGSITLENN